MLDLNIDAVSVDSICDESSVPKSLTAIEKVLDVSAGAQKDDSGTSVSSVVNADEAPASTGGDADSSSTFNFDMIFNKSKCGTYIESSAPSTELVTRQLFPANGGGRNYEFGSKSTSATSLLRPQWLNLSVPEPAPDHQLKIFEDQKPPQQQQTQVRKSRRGPRSRSSQYRGVTFYRRTGRWESHIWDCGKQVYLGGFDTAHAAARAYDRAAVKFRGVDADINFTISDYEDDLKQMKDLTKEEFVHILRRQSTGFSRGSSKYRGVTLHKCGRWEARMGQLLGKKAYDKAAMECNGREAVTNFEPSTYEGEVNLVSNKQERQHNLDLNLWISPPSGGQKGSDNVRSLHLHDAAYRLPDGKRTKVESFASAPLGGETPYALTMASKHQQTWPGIYSSFPPNYEERAIRKTEAEAVPSLGFSNWAWQMNGHGVVTPVPLFSTAASSGFASTTPVFSGSLQPLNTQNKKLCLPSLPTRLPFTTISKSETI